MNKFKYNINYKVKIDDAFKKKLEKKYKKIATIISEFLNISKPLFFDVTFTSLNQIHKINKEKRDVDKPTDVISFSLWDYDTYRTELLGDIFICYQFCLNEAKENKWSIEYEFCLMFTHGLLHLLQFNHSNKDEEKEMFDLTDKILNGVVDKN